MDLIDREAAIEAIDHEREILLNQGRDGAEHVVVHHARRLIEDMPTILAVPLDKLCKWLAVCTDDPPCISLRFCDCGIVCREKKPSDAECWKTVITKWMHLTQSAGKR